jgi:hypothetical protein
LVRLPETPHAIADGLFQPNLQEVCLPPPQRRPHNLRGRERKRGGLLDYSAAIAEAQHMNLDQRPPHRNLAPGEAIGFWGK